MNLIPVILSGGSGARLWPVSRAAYPKQLLPLFGSQTLLQQTAIRAMQAAGSQQLILVCNTEHRFLVAEQLQQISVAQPRILLEPIGKNTAPAIAIAAFEAIRNNPDAVLLVLPSDHLIPDIDGFCKAVNTGYSHAENDALVTFGIQPTKPETGFGYIKAESANNVSAIAQFIEKPDVDTAKSFLKAGGYYWNSGMFMFKAQAYLSELKIHAPEIFQICQKTANTLEHDLDFLRIPEAAFSQCPANSIDYAVMEKTQNACVVSLDAQWSDLGSWQALWNVGLQDADGNVSVGDTLIHDTENSYVRSESRLVGALGIKDLVIVETSDAVLVADKNSTEQVKLMVNQLLANDREEAKQHKVAYRPWGHYEVLVERDGFKVKRTLFKPNTSLSLQTHEHRAEHWIVVKGTAEVTCGDKVFTLRTDQSTYIPIGEKHRLKNIGETDLELIEVQSGSYLNEDDIIRFED